MRRKDREITGFEEIVDVIQRCEVLRIGLVDPDGKPYIVPLTFGLEIEGSKVTFYFHSAREGRKMDILRENPFVCFEMEATTGFITHETACRWSARHETVMGEGTVHCIEDPREKLKAFQNIMLRNGFQGVPEFNPVFFKQAAVCRIEVSQLSGKRNLGTAPNQAE